MRIRMRASRRKLGDDHPACFESMHERAVLYMRQDRYEEAEPLLLDAFQGRETKLGPEHPYTIESLKQLMTLYESWPKPDEAAKSRKAVTERSRRRVTQHHKSCCGNQW